MDGSTLSIDRSGVPTLSIGDSLDREGRSIARSRDRVRGRTDYTSSRDSSIGTAGHEPAPRPDDALDLDDEARLVRFIRAGVTFARRRRGRTTRARDGRTRATDGRTDGR